ncbi:MAG: LPS export ABC transporter permease LptG [Hyphomicrobiales bacterium]|nr:MAG: LPS export ABC transporter permease LptG [Hyphomicrobiales bacterium]
MTGPGTLSRYIAARFAWGFLGALAITMLLFFIVELIELPRRAEGNYQADLAELMLLALYRLPSRVEQTMIFSVLYGAMWTFIALSRRQELVVIWALGQSIWKFLRAPLVVTVLIGLASVALFNPFAAAMMSKFERFEAQLRLDSKDIGNPSRANPGLWLRQNGVNGPSILHARHSADRGLKLYRVVVLRYQTDSDKVLWINAEEAELIHDRWFLSNAWVANPDGEISFWKAYTISTNLSPAQVISSLSDPGTISFWSLRENIKLADAAGLSSTRYRMQFQALLARPILMCAMILIAATFSLRIFRFENVVRMVLGGLVSGFVLFFVNSWSWEIGTLGMVPVMVAAWFPALVALAIGATAIFVQESR